MPMYSFGLYLFALGALVASLFNEKINKMVNGISDTFRLLHAHIKPTDRVVWFHAASLGEFEQGRPLIERLRQSHPEYKILLTFFSPSGFEVRKNYQGADLVCYLPFDTPGNVASFIRLAHPEIAIFIKYEFWTNYLTSLHRHGVKVYSVSSIFRRDQHFFRWFGTTKPLRQFDKLFVQNELSRQILHENGIDNTMVVGDTRLDRVIDIRKAAADLPVVQDFVGGRCALVVGSSWGPDEEIYIPYFASRKKGHKLIIAPHVISETHLKEIEKLLVDNGLSFVRYTEIEDALEGKTSEENCAGINPEVLNYKSADVLIVDCFGKLSSIYRYGKVAIVGGGFGVGIHNVPEAAVYGIPVLFGPNNKKFREAQDLKACGGAFEYNDAQSFAAIMDRFLADDQFMRKAGKAAGDYINSNAGAADKVFKEIFEK